MTTPRTAGTAVRLGTWPDGSPEWLRQRRSGIGGSDIAQVMGISPWGDAYSLWCEKTTTDEPQERSTPLMEAGHYVELAAARWYADHHLPEGMFLRNTGTWAHAERPWQHANPDRLVCTRRSDASVVGLVEIKYSPNRPHEWGPDGSDEVPVHYWAQAQWYMSTFGVDWCDVVALSTWGFRRLHVDADRDWADVAVEEGRRFWGAVEYGIPPSWSPTPWAYEADRRRHPDIDPGSTVTVSDASVLAEIAAAADEQRRLREATRAAKPAAEQAKATLAHLMGSAEQAITANGTVIATRQARGKGTPFVVLK